MSSETNNQQDKGQDLNVLGIVTTGAAFFLITAIVIMFLYGLYLRTVQAETARKAGGLGDEVFALKQAQREDLATVGWIDPEKGIVRIPIDEAIELTVEKYNKTGDAADQAPDNAGGNPCGDMSGGAPPDASVAGGDGSDMAGRPLE